MRFELPREYTVNTGNMDMGFS